MSAQTGIGTALTTSRGRRPGYRHAEETRERIRAADLIARLTRHALSDKPIMDPTQVRAAEILLKKILPDQKQIEHTGEGGGTLTVQIVKFGDGDGDPE